MSFVRPLTEGDLLRPAQRPDELSLIDVAERYGQAARERLPGRQARGPVALELGAPQVIADVSAGMWSGAGLATVVPSETARGVVVPPLVSSVTEARALLDEGHVIVVERAEEWSSSLAPLHDDIVAAWSTSCSISVLLAVGSYRRTIDSGALISCVQGHVSLGTADSEIPLAAGFAAHVEPGVVELRSAGISIVVEVRLRSFGADVVLDQLHRRVGYDPLFRADLPRWPEESFTSYSGNLLDEVNSLHDALLALYDEEDLWSQALCWWNASLAFRIGSLAAALDDRPAIPAFPAVPSFLDDRLMKADPNSVAMAVNGRMVALSPGELAQFLSFVDDPESRQFPSTLRQALVSAGLVRVPQFDSWQPKLG